MSLSFNQVLEALADEHRELMSLADRIRSHRSVVGLVPLLEELHTILIRHFSHEQFPGGLYECMGARGSQYHHDLEVLVEDHCRILSSVRGLLERTRMADADDQPALLEELHRVLEELVDHEHREHALADKLVSDSDGS